MYSDAVLDRRLRDHTARLASAERRRDSLEERLEGDLSKRERLALRREFIKVGKIIEDETREVATYSKPHDEFRAPLIVSETAAIAKRRADAEYARTHPGPTAEEKEERKWAAWRAKADQMHEDIVSGRTNIHVPGTSMSMNEMQFAAERAQRVVHTLQTDRFSSMHVPSASADIHLQQSMQAQQDAMISRGLGGYSPQDRQRMLVELGRYEQRTQDTRQFISPAERERRDQALGANFTAHYESMGAVRLMQKMIEHNAMHPNRPANVEGMLPLLTQVGSELPRHDQQAMLRLIGNSMAARAARDPNMLGEIHQFVDALQRTGMDPANSKAMLTPIIQGYSAALGAGRPIPFDSLKELYAKLDRNPDVISSADALGMMQQLSRGIFRNLANPANRNPQYSELASFTSSLSLATVDKDKALSTLSLNLSPPPGPNEAPGARPAVIRIPPGTELYSTVMQLYRENQSGTSGVRLHAERDGNNFKFTLVSLADSRQRTTFSSSGVPTTDWLCANIQTETAKMRRGPAARPSPDDPITL